MGKKSIRKNYIYNLTYQILTLITPIITAPYLSRILGASGIGTYSYIESVCSYFVLFATLGLTTFGQREISYVQENKEKRSIIFWETNIIELIASALCIIAYVCFSLTQRNWQLYIVMVFNLVAVIANISWFFQGMEEFGKIVFRNIIFKFLNIAYIFIFIKNRDDLIWYIFGISFFTFLNNASYWLSIGKYIEKPNWNKIHPGRHLKTIFSLFIPTIAVQIYTVLDKTMIGIITNSSYENGYYEQALKISRMVLTLVTSLGTVMIPRIGYHFEKGEKEQVRFYMYRGYKFVWFLGIPLCFGLILISSNFVPWFFGNEYRKVIPLLGILSFLILAVGINNVTGIQYLIPTKKQNIFTRTVVYGTIINVLLNYFLISKYQSFGAAIASVVAESFIAIIQIYIIRDELSPKIIMKSSINYFIAGLIMALVLIAVRGFFVSSIINTMILIFIGAIVYFFVLILIHDDFFFSNISTIFNKIRRK